MNMSRHAPGPSRLTGIGLVALIHLVLAWALVHGLIRQAFEAPKPPIVVRPLDPAQPPTPPEPHPEPTIVLKDPVLTPLTPPEVPQDAAAPPVATVSLFDSTPATAATEVAGTRSGPAGPAGPAVAPPAVLPAGPVPPRLVCTQMGTPEAPALSWSGEAVFRVLATVRNGRVTAAEIHALRGNMDTKTRRALQSAIDTTLRSSYECPGNHQFEQEFQFRIE